MNFLIVGGTSMIGGRIRRRLEPDHGVTTAGRAGRADLAFDLVGGDEPSAAGATFDALIHCAAAFGADRPGHWVENELVNSVGALRVALLAASARCRHVVYLSSLSIYDHPENAHFGSYGLSKRHGQENLELACDRLGIGFTSIVLAQVYDDLGAARAHQPMFYALLDRAARGEDVTIFGSADPLRNFLFVDDVAEIVGRVVSGGVRGTFPCLHPDSHRLGAIAGIAFEVFGRGGRVRFDPSRPDPPTVFLPDDRRLFDAISYRPETDLRAGIARVRDAGILGRA